MSTSQDSDKILQVLECHIIESQIANADSEINIKQRWTQKTRQLATLYKIPTKNEQRSGAS